MLIKRVCFSCIYLSILFYLFIIIINKDDVMHCIMYQKILKASQTESNDSAVSA